MKKIAIKMPKSEILFDACVKQFERLGYEYAGYKKPSARYEAMCGSFGTACGDDKVVCMPYEDFFNLDPEDVQDEPNKTLSVEELEKLGYKITIEKTK